MSLINLRSAVIIKFIETRITQPKLELLQCSQDAQTGNITCFKVKETSTQQDIK